MWDIIRSSFGGEVIHLLSGGRLLKFPDQQPDFVIPANFGKVPESHADSVMSLQATSNMGDVEEKGKEGDFLPKILNEKVVDWYGPDDPENPRNWSTLKKTLIVAEICVLTTVVYMGSAMYTPGIEQIMEEFHIGYVAAAIPVSAYVLAYGIGPMIFAPLSEAPLVGRNWIYLPTLYIFVILQVPTALVSNIGGFIVVRVVSGFISSPPMSNGAGSLGDMFSLKYLPYGLAFWSAAAITGPVAGPLLGSVFSQILGWRWTFWFMAWTTGLTAAILTFFLPETSSATILHRRARRLRKLTGENYTTAAVQEYAHMTLSSFLYESFVRPFIITFTEPGIFFLNCYTALIYAIIYSWFEAFPIVFLGVYQFNTIETGLSYLGITISISIAIAMYCGGLYVYIGPRLMKGAPPEIIFNIAVVVAPFLPIGLLMFGWTSTASIHWIVPIIGNGIFAASGWIIFNCVFNYLGLSYPRFLASVFGGNDFFRSGIAAALPLVARDMFLNLGSPGDSNKFPVSYGMTVLAGISCLMVAIPVAILFLGARLRATSKYAN